MWLAPDQARWRQWIRAGEQNRVPDRSLRVRSLTPFAENTAEMFHQVEFEAGGVDAFISGVANVRRKPFSKEAIAYHVTLPLARRLPLPNGLRAPIGARVLSRLL
jgi:hypothetical protein